MSVITALLPRMSRFAAEGKTADVRAAFSSGLRLSSVIIMPAAALMLVLGPEITTVLFAHGNTSSDDALVIARVMQMFAIALVPFSIYQLMLRVFYAHGDTRTPALVGLVVTTSNIVMAFTAYNVLDVKWIVVGIAGGFAITNLVGTITCWLVLRRKLGGIDGRRIVGGHLKLLVAIWPLVGFAYAAHTVADALARHRHAAAGTRHPRRRIRGRRAALRVLRQADAGRGDPDHARHVRAAPAGSGKVKGRAAIRRATGASNHYHVGDYGLRGDTLGNAKRRVGGVSCHATNMGSDHLCRTLP
ncbi:murein biosynthesis integral membrane protein MurJ [Actinomadura madurae]|uniref:murein biosynthesis integral membrane protein MurJ n=1 Tax=Actinomadura madurae TaxID=1993 RepID=UPI0020D220EF|nr:lipid II flippase MurJ [Actinomadura madurae]